LRVTQSGETIGQFDGRRVGAAVIARAKRHLLHLARCGVDQRLAAVAATDVPQAGKSVDKAVAVGVDQVRAFGLDPNPGVGVARVLV